MIQMSREDLQDRLSRLDEEAFYSLHTEARFHMVIVGGGALILRQYINRYTTDIDVVSTSRELAPLLEKYHINTRAEAYINSFPFCFEDRLVPLMQGRKIDFFTASLEDIVVAKLNAMRPPDIIDIYSEDVLAKIDWDLLENLVLGENEAKASALNERNYNELLGAYKDYIRRCKLCGS